MFDPVTDKEAEDELAALQQVYIAIKDLRWDSKLRVLNHLLAMFEEKSKSE